MSCQLGLLIFLEKVLEGFLGEVTEAEVPRVLHSTFVFVRQSMDILQALVEYLTLRVVQSA